MSVNNNNLEQASGDHSSLLNEENSGENGEIDEKEEEDTNKDREESSTVRTESTQLGDVEFLYGAKHVIHLFVPVSINMVLTIIIWHLTEKTEKNKREEEPNLSSFLLFQGNRTTGSKAGDATLNGLILIVALVLITGLMLVLFLCKCYKVITWWLYCATALIMFGVGLWTLSEIVAANNFPMDWISCCLLVWNYGVVGLVCIFIRPTLRLQQFYLIINCAMTTVFYIRMLPEITAWIFLGLMALWDTFAVLAPCGPLRIMVEKAHEREEKLGMGLIYTGGIAFLNAEPSQKSQAISIEAIDEDDEIFSNDDSIRLGLGDFVFYSLLVGEAAKTGDVNATMACFLAILVGLCATLIVLSITKKALPALPISIIAGLGFYFSGIYVISPFCRAMAASQLFF